MPLLCPTCRTPIDPASSACAQGHAFPLVEGVRSLLTLDLAHRLAAFEAALSAARQAEGKHQLAEVDYAQLPFSAAADAQPGLALEWRLRRYDLALIERRLAGRAAQRVLDLGAWNGWLSHRLARAGHTVTAIDYFADAPDGLRAKRFYRTDWRAIQLDLRDPSVLAESFDLVVVNRCLAFFTDPAGYVQTLKPLVAHGGQLLVTGLQFFWAHAAKAQRVAADRRRYQERYGFELFLFPTRGYLDRTDHRRLAAQGLALHPYRQLWAANLRAFFQPARPRHAYGVWVNGEASP